MVQVEFDIDQNIIIIQSNLTDPFKEIVSKFLKKAQIESETLSFFTNGIAINLNGTLESKMNQINKQNKIIKILVKSTKLSEQQKKLIKSKDIICPQCYEPCRIKFDNYKFKLFECPNNHISENISINKFPETQMINMNKIICHRHKDKNMGNSYNNEFYKCLTCGYNICMICKVEEHKEHDIIRYDIKNYIYCKHNSSFTKYCNECKINLCILCSKKEHKSHNQISYEDIDIDIDNIKENLLQIKNMLHSFNNNIENIIIKLSELKEIINIYYNIYYDIINNNDIRNSNYNRLLNIKDIYNNEKIFKELNGINNINDISKQFNAMINLYNKITLKNPIINDSSQNNLPNSQSKTYKDIMEDNNKTSSNKTDDNNNKLLLKKSRIFLKAKIQEYENEEKLDTLRIVLNNYLEENFKDVNSLDDDNKNKINEEFSYIFENLLEPAINKNMNLNLIKLIVKTLGNCQKIFCNSIEYFAKDNPVLNYENCKKFSKFLKI